MSSTNLGVCRSVTSQCEHRATSTYRERNARDSAQPLLISLPLRRHFGPCPTPVQVGDQILGTRISPRAAVGRDETKLQVRRVWEREKRRPFPPSAWRKSNELAEGGRPQRRMTQHCESTGEHPSRRGLVGHDVILLIESAPAHRCGADERTIGTQTTAKQFTP
jgi:hypothetical protein